MRSRVRFSQEVNKTLFSLFVTLTTMIVVLGGVHFYISSEASQQRYDLSEIQAENTSLRSTSADLDTKIVESLSSDQLKDSLEIKDMLEPETREYIDES